MRRRLLSAPLSPSREILRRSLLHASASGPKRPEKQDPWHICCNSCILALHLSEYRAGSAFPGLISFAMSRAFQAGVEKNWNRPVLCSCHGAPTTQRTASRMKIHIQKDQVATVPPERRLESFSFRDCACFKPTLCQN
jgi:hypothetical protein